MSQTLTTTVLPRPVEVAGVVLDVLSLVVALVFVVLYAAVALTVLAGRLVVLRTVGRGGTGLSSAGRPATL